MRLPWVPWSLLVKRVFKMELQDFSCCVSGISLTQRETGFILLSCPSGHSNGDSFTPISLPIWGRYNGLGGFEEIQDGPNADLLLSCFQRELAAGNLRINFQRLGLPEYTIDSLDLLIGIFFCAQIHCPEAIEFNGATIRFALVSAHIAAQLMEKDPNEVPLNLTLEQLPHFIFNEQSLGRAIYQPLENQSLKLRLKFGLSLLSLQSLTESLSLRQLSLIPPDSHTTYSEDTQAKSLLNALARFSEDEVMMQALSECAQEIQSSSDAAL